MKLTKRSAITAAVLGSVAVAAAIAVPSGTAQTPAAATLTFYEPDAQTVFKFIDNPPKTLGSRPGPRSRLSIGDRVVIAGPLYDKKGGTRQGRVYVDAVIVKGGNFETALAQAAGTYGLTDGSQIAVQGTFAFGKESTLPIVGGTGTYEGASGHLVTTGDDNSSTDTLTILP